jgi:hypothetical protein
MGRQAGQRPCYRTSPWRAREVLELRLTPTAEAFAKNALSPLPCIPKSSPTEEAEE